MRVSLGREGGAFLALAEEGEFQKKEIFSIKPFNL